MPNPLSPRDTQTAAVLESAMKLLKTSLPPGMDAWIAIGKLEDDGWKVHTTVDTAEDYLKWIKGGDRNDD